MTLPAIPKDRDWSPETWRAGLDEAVRRDVSNQYDSWQTYASVYNAAGSHFAVIAHATTLLDAGIVKPVVGEGAALWDAATMAWREANDDAAIAVIDAALAKARLVL
jgi:hypothetical protein